MTVTVGPLEDGFYVADDGPGFTVYVADDGPGFTEENREHAFEHGFTTSEDGTGFGLSTVETICRAHGWDIRLDGAEGGARFEITGIGPAEHSYPLAEDLIGVIVVTRNSFTLAAPPDVRQRVEPSGWLR